MIIIGTKEEIEAMIKAGCPHMTRHTVGCDQDCRACWNRSASIVIVRPEKVGTVEKDIDGVSFLERLKEGENDRQVASKLKQPCPCETCQTAIDRCGCQMHLCSDYQKWKESDGNET